MIIINALVGSFYRVFVYAINMGNHFTDVLKYGLKGCSMRLRHLIMLTMFHYICIAYGLFISCLWPKAMVGRL